MNGYRFEHETNPGVAWDGEGRTEVAMVGEYWHESLKNQALAEAVLGRAVLLADPAIVVTGEDIERGRRCLEQAFGGEAPNDFWFGCMGSAGDYYGELKDWGRENWCTVLRHLVRERATRFVLVGNEAERASLEKLRAESDVGERVRVLTGDVGEAVGLSELLGLAWLSRGYLGRDTGPMHIAGAVGGGEGGGGGVWGRDVAAVYADGDAILGGSGGSAVLPVPLGVQASGIVVREAGAGGGCRGGVGYGNLRGKFGSSGAVDPADAGVV